METPILYNKSENLITLMNVESKVCKWFFCQKFKIHCFDTQNFQALWYIQKLLQKQHWCNISDHWQSVVCKEVGAYPSVTFSPILTPSWKQRFQVFLEIKGSGDTQPVSPVLQNLFSECKHGCVNISFISPLTPHP